MEKDQKEREAKERESLKKIESDADKAAAEHFKETKDKDETGQSIRQSKSGKYFIFVISEKTHNPYCKYLKDKKKV